MVVSQSREYPTFLLPEKAPNLGTQTILRHLIFRIHLQNPGTNRIFCMKFRIESTDSMCVTLIFYDFPHTFCGLPQITEVMNC